MKRLSVILFALVLTIYGCGSDTATAPKPYVNTDGYPISTCVVSGRKLGDMGEPYVVKYNSKTVKFCCSACLKEFNSEPAKYMALIEDAEKRHSAVK